MKKPKGNIIIRILKILGKTILGILILIFIAVTLFLWSMSSSSEGIEYNVSGTVKNFEEERIKKMYIDFNSKKVVTKTDSIGNFLLHKPNELFITFHREGYQSVKTMIQNYSDLGIYTFTPFELEKSVDTIPVFKELKYEKEKDTTKQLNFSGQIKDIYGNPIDNVLVTLTDTINNDVSFDGTFDFNRGAYVINFEKKGYEKLTIKITDFYNKRTENIGEIMLLNKIENGIYFVQENNLLKLPRTRLKKKSKRMKSNSFWNGGSYSIDTFYVPKNVKQFKVAKSNKIPLKVVVYEEGYNHILLAPESHNVLCYVNNKSIFSNFPVGIYREKQEGDEYFDKWYDRIDEKGKVLELVLEPDASEKTYNYVLVSAHSNKGYYFTY